MVRATVDAINDRVGRAFQFVVEDQPTQYRLVGLLSVKRETGDVGLAVCRTHRAVHRFDNVAADAEIAPGWFEVGLQVKRARPCSQKPDAGGAVRPKAASAAC
jgi:hypothetical protein